MSDSRKKTFVRFAAVVAVAALATWLRWDGLTDRSLWFDEAFSWTLGSRFSLAEMVERTALDVHPPFYYATLRAWVAVAGESEFALRSLSALCGVGTVVALFIFCRACFSRRSADVGSDTPSGNAFDAGVIAAGACAVSAYHIHWSQETRMYTLATLLAVASAWSLLRAWEEPAKARFWALYAAFAAALLYTHNYAIFTVFGQGLFAIGMVLASCRREGASFLKSKALRNSSLAFLSVAWAYAPWVPVLLFQKAQVQESYWIGEIDWTTVPSSWFALAFPENDYVISDRRAAVVLALVASGTLAMFVRFTDWRRNLILVHILVPVICSVAISITTVSIIVPRHFLLSFMFFLCALAGTIVDATRGPWRWTAFVWILAVGVAVNYQYQAVELNSDERPGIRGAIAALREARKPGEPVVVLHPCLYFSAVYYLKESDPKLYLPNQTASHFTGGPILQASDFISPTALSEVDADAIWVMDTSGFNLSSGRFPLPPEWSPVESSRGVFQDVYYFQGQVFLTRYVRAGTDERATAAGDSVTSSSK